MSHNGQFNDAEKSQIKELVREVVHELKDSGFMAQVRETARQETAALCASSCPFKQQLIEWAGKAMIGFLAICVVLGACIYGAIKAAVAIGAAK